MRAKNYLDQKATFTPLEPQQMLRVALVEGIKPKYPNNERQKYKKLLEEFLGIDCDRIYKLFRLMELDSPTEPQQNFLKDLVMQAAYDSVYWKPFDYDKLKREGIIITHDGNLKGLAKLLQEIDESKVISVPSVGDRAIAPEDEPDYLKHIDWRNKLFLNGRDVVRRFAEKKGIELPSNYLQHGRMTAEVLNLLEQNGFYFNEALKTGIDDVLKALDYKDRTLVSMVIKRKDGTELRLHPHDFVEAAEFYIYCWVYNRDIIDKLGKKLSANDERYYGANVHFVPKRTPVKGQEYNEVEWHYFPNLLGKGPYPLDWMNTRVTCNCPHALNMRNFEERKGKMTRVVETMDTHAGVIFLEYMKIKGISHNKAVNNMSPIPTLEFSDIVDKTRYNLIQEFEVEGGKTRRTYVGEVGIEKVIYEIAKSPNWSFDKMFNPNEKIGTQLLKPMYIEQKQ